MRHTSRSLAPIPIALTATLALLSCGDPASPTGDGGAPGATIVVEPHEALLGIGNEVSLAAEVRGVAGVYYTLGADGSRFTPGVVWKSSNPSIVALRGEPATAVGLSEGKAELTASYGGMAATIPVTVRASATPLVIAEFHVLEEPLGDAARLYAPKLRLASTAERPATAILGWELTMPGTFNRYGCRSNVTLSPGVMFELFSEAYGDYAYSFDLSAGTIRSDGFAQIRVKVQTADGGIIVVPDSGAVVRATQPPAYNGSINPQLCLFR